MQITLQFRSWYLKIIADTSVIFYVEFTNATDCVSTKVTNNIPTNFANTVSIDPDDEKVRTKMDYYILHTSILVITLHNRYYLLSLWKTQVKTKTLTI